MRNKTPAAGTDWPNETVADSAKMERLARLGYAAKGVVYAVVAWLAIQAAFTAGAETAGSKGALARILSETYGGILLAVVAVGLAAYSVWRFVQCFADPEKKGTDIRGLATRALFFTSGVLHASLVVWSVRLMLGSADPDRSDGGAELFAAQLMSHPFGPWAVAAVGLTVAGVGIGLVVRGWTERFEKQLDLSEVSERGRDWLARSGKLGLTALGVVFVIIGGFFVVAGLNANAEQAKGVGASLRALEHAPYGPYLLGAVGAGLMAYAVHQFVNARFRILPAPD